MEDLKMCNKKLIVFMSLYVSMIDVHATQNLTKLRLPVSRLVTASRRLPQGPMPIEILKQKAPTMPSYMLRDQVSKNLNELNKPGYYNRKTIDGLREIESDNYLIPTYLPSPELAKGRPEMPELGANSTYDQVTDWYNTNNLGIHDPYNSPLQTDLRLGMNPKYDLYDKLLARQQIRQELETMDQLGQFDERKLRMLRQRETDEGLFPRAYLPTPELDQSRPEMPELGSNSSEEKVNQWFNKYMLNVHDDKWSNVPALPKDRLQRFMRAIKGMAKGFQEAFRGAENSSN